MIFSLLAQILAHSTMLWRVLDAACLFICSFQHPLYRLMASLRHKESEMSLAHSVMLHKSAALAGKEAQAGKAEADAAAEELEHIQKQVSFCSCVCTLLCWDGTPVANECLGRGA